MVLEDSYSKIVVTWCFHANMY